VAIEISATQVAHTDRPGLSGRDLERIARATLAGPRRAAAAVVESAPDLLSCERAVLLRPTDAAGALAACTFEGDHAARHEVWQLGSRAHELFERTSHTADGWREPWSELRIKLRGLGVRSWAAVPLRNEGSTRPLGLLIVGARNVSARPCPDLHRLPDLALSATAALSSASESDRIHEADTRSDDAHERLRTVGNLAFGVSHTLGNIFGAIIGNLQFLEEEATSDEVRELLDRIKRSTTDGLQLMRSLQAFAAVPAEGFMCGVDLSEIAGRVATLTRGLIGHWPGHRRVQIETELAPAPAWGDERQIRQAVINMVFNALQAVGRDGQVIVRTNYDAGRSEIRVVDDGPGMNDDLRRRATEPFFTTHPSLHEGLGLTVARGVAVGHRGMLTLHRAPTHGTEVAFRLPRDRPAPTRSAALADGHHGTDPGATLSPAALLAAAVHRKEHRR
jgi:signal transduction histidine kinase